MMDMRVGTFLSPTSTGNDSFDTGLVNVPTALWLHTAYCEDPGAPLLEDAMVAYGATDGTNQWTSAAIGLYDDTNPASSAINYVTTQYLDDKLLSVVDMTGTVLLEAEIVSFNIDGSVTLNWTVVQATPVMVGFMAWDEVTAEAGTNLISDSDEPGVTVNVGFEPKVVLGGNSINVNDGTVAAGYAHAASATVVSEDTSGGLWTIRGSLLGNLLTDTGVDDVLTPLSWYQADTIASARGWFDTFTATGFRIALDFVNIGVTDEPVGWLALGDGGDWFAAVQGLGSANPNFPLNGWHPIGCFVAQSMQPGASEEINTVNWGAWDRGDNQWVVVNYIEQQTTGSPNFSLQGRAYYDDQVWAAFQDFDTFLYSDANEFLLGPESPNLIETGTGPNPNALFFLYIPEAQERAWATLV